MSISNAEMYRNVDECYRCLRNGDVLHLAHLEALEYMYQAALGKLEGQSQVIDEIDNDMIVSVLNQKFNGYGLSFQKPDGNALPTVRIKVKDSKYLKEDSSVSLTEEFYAELTAILNKYKIPVIQWNNNRTSFWWTPKK